VKVSILWWIKAALIIAGFASPGCAVQLGFHAALLLLLISGWCTTCARCG